MAALSAGTARFGGFSSGRVAAPFVPPRTPPAERAAAADAAPGHDVGEADVERALFRWLERYRRRHAAAAGSAPVGVAELRRKALALARRLGAPTALAAQLTRAWVRRWQARYGVADADADSPPSFPDTDAASNIVDRDACVRPPPPPLLLDYTDEQVYVAVALEMRVGSLPDRALWTSGAAGDRVWVLGASDRTGRHRTRLLVIGRHWRPPCLAHVNMLSQPVVYAGGGSGVLTPDLFAWWFRREFCPAASAVHGARGAVLVPGSAVAALVRASGELSSDDGSVRLLAPGGPAVDTAAVSVELRARYAQSLLYCMTADAGDAEAAEHWLRRWTLLDAFPLLHRAWLSVRGDAFQRCWMAAGAAPPEPDRLLLLELQWAAHDRGLEVADADLAAWARAEDLDAEDREPEPAVKAEPPDDAEDAGGNLRSAPATAAAPASAPTAAEAASALTTALRWMESQPLEPASLLLVRDVLLVARQASKMGLAPTHPGATLPFFCHNGEHLTQPPPAHMGIPPYQLDGKGAGAMGEYWRGLGLGLGLGLRGSAAGAPPAASTAAPAAPAPAPAPAPAQLSPGDWKKLAPLLAASGLTRPPMYPFSTGQYPYPMLSPEMSQVAASWHTPSMYPISTAGAGFRSPYPTSLPITSTSLSSDFYRFSPTGLLPAHPGLSPHSHPHSLASHPAIVTPGPKQELAAADHNHRSTALDQKNSTSSTTEGTKAQDSAQTSNNQDKKKPHIKKPLNAFMLYMKEMRAKVVAECTLKESAAINQILGRRWHSLSREEQAKYYEKARQERQLHMQLYPGWSARDNYGYGAKKKKRKKERSADPGGNSMKKCRARYGLDQQNQWCKPCRRKKKCIRYMESGESADGNQSEDNLGSCGSAGEAHTPPDDDADGDGESLPHSLSSPGGLSGLSSLTSPSMILPSPGTSLASPSVSLASPCVSLQSPLTPHDPSGSSAYECKPPVTNSVPLPLPPPSLHHHHHPPHQHHPPPGPQPHRNPVGTNPRDVNNPLSVNQLTGQCIKSEGGGTGQDSSSASRPVISVT
ncbi:uncharacterized protein LOC126456504 [Schistocerca serialis cubense]|uniref:uncharacterized protein LOC126456504 n=1 Tax=Schistocerca serialis cubense TaxID=2023355 RepID=UPI00214E9169|nr:uncharacterized protein LOC126456504 [Schistocerca serialis cubense]